MPRGRYSMFGHERWRVGGWGVAVSIALTLLPDIAAGQARNVLERNLPPTVSGAGGLQGAGGSALAQDATPLGPTIAGIRLVGLKEPVLATPPSGLSFQGVEGLTLDRLREVLAPFLGKPLSRRLVSEVQSAVANSWFVQTSAFYAGVVFDTDEDGSGGGTVATTETSADNEMVAEEALSSCTGGAAGVSCTSVPHPQNTRVGRFLRFLTPRTAPGAGL